MPGPRRLSTGGRGREAGTTVVELVVSMSALSVLLVVFMAAVTSMAASTRRVYAVTDVTTQARAALDVLSRQLAYASAVNTPVRTGSGWYVEFASDVVSAGSNPQCTQWRYTSGAPSGSLQYRTWDAVTLAATGWATLSSSVVNDPATQPPFTLLPTDSGFGVLRMVVDVRLRSATGTTVQSQGQYTMRNSVAAPVPTATTVCTQLGRP